VRRAGAAPVAQGIAGVLARRSSPPRASLAAFLPSWQGVDRHPAARRRYRPPARGARAAAGPRAAGRDLGGRRAAARAPAPTTDVAGRSLRERRGRVGRCGPLGAPGAWPSTSARTPGDRAAVSRPRRSRRRPSAWLPSTSCSVRALRRGRASSPTCSPSSTPPPRLRSALGFVWRKVTNDAWAPLRAPHLAARPRPAGQGGRRGRPGAAPAPAAVRAAPGRSRFAGRRTGAHSQVQGRWVSDRLGLRAPAEERQPDGAAQRRRSRSCCSSAMASSPASRCSRRASPRLRIAYETFSTSRPLGFCGAATIGGDGGAQFALPGAVERLRAAPPPERLRHAGHPPRRPGPALRARCRGRGARVRSAGRRVWRSLCRARPRTSPCCTSSAADGASSPSPRPHRAGARLRRARTPG